MMKRWMTTVFVLMALSCSVFAAEVEEGFTALFNGKNLSGWNIENGGPKTFVVQNGVIYCSGRSHYPAWLRSDREYENFDLRFEFRLDGWCNSGVFFHAPRYGRCSKVGFEYQIDQMSHEGLRKKSAGAVFDVVAPSAMALGPDKSWNTGRILMDWPNLKYWMNGQIVQDINVEDYPELKYRFRHGYIGLQDMGYQVWFRNIRVKELPGKEEWRSLFNGKNFKGWYQEGSGAHWSIVDGNLHATGGTSYLVTEDEFEDFELQTYIRTSRTANGGIFIRWKTLSNGDRGNEIQIENVPDSNYPTGSLYNIVRAPMFHYEDEAWFPMQIILKGSHVVVRVNGETVVDSDEVPTVRAGHISLQMHSNEPWIEFKDLQIKPL
ncbi:MAG: DUF1080 domain-containing protein [bacterium]|nr:DUF1080 domain-containing protein [bacterium]